MVIGISGTAVRLADAGGEVVTVTLSGLLAGGDFAVLDARPRPGMPQVRLLDDLPEGTVQQALWWQWHIVEVLTGIPPDSVAGTRPRPEYDPETRHPAAAGDGQGGRIRAPGRRCR